MNDRQESKLARYIEKYGITKEEIDGIFAKKDTTKEEQEEDILTDDEEDFKTETKTEVTKEEKVEEPVKEETTDSKQTEEKTDSSKEQVEEKVEKENEESKQASIIDELKAALGGMTARIETLEEKLNSFKDTENTEDDFGKSSTEMGKNDSIKENGFSSFAKELGAK